MLTQDAFTFPIPLSPLLPIPPCPSRGSQGAEQPPRTQAQRRGGEWVTGNPPAAWAASSEHAQTYSPAARPLGSCWSSRATHGCFAHQGSCSAPTSSRAFGGAGVSQMSALIWSLEACCHLVVPHRSTRLHPCCPSGGAHSAWAAHAVLGGCCRIRPPRALGQLRGHQLLCCGAGTDPRTGNGGRCPLFRQFNPGSSCPGFRPLLPVDLDAFSR